MQLDHAAGHEGKAFVVDGLIEHPVQQLSRKRSRDGKLRPLLRRRDDAHVQIGPQALRHEFQMGHDLPGGGGGGGHHVVMLAQPRGGAVVHDMPVLAQASGRSARARPSGSRTCSCRRNRETPPRPAPVCRSCPASRHPRRPRRCAPWRPRGRSLAPCLFAPAPGNRRGGTTAPPRSSAQPRPRAAASLSCAARAQSRAPRQRRPSRPT